MNPHDQPSPEELDRLARRLASWTPSAPSSGRDRVLFAAGVAAGRRQARRRAAVVVAALAIGSGAGIVHEHRAKTRLEVALAGRSPAAERVSADPRPGPLPRPNLTTTRPAPSSYLALSHRYSDEPGLGPPADLVAPRRTSPAPIGPILTPLSSRRFAETSDL